MRIYLTTTLISVQEDLHRTIRGHPAEEQWNRGIWECVVPLSMVHTLLTSSSFYQINMQMSFCSDKLELSHSLASTLLQDCRAVAHLPSHWLLSIRHPSIVAFHPEFWTIPHNSCLNYSWLSFHQTLRAASSGPHPGHTDVNYGYWIIHISPFIFHLINHVWCLSLSRALAKSQRSVYLNRI